jgi:hypothetical protein
MEEMNRGGTGHCVKKTEEKLPDDARFATHASSRQRDLSPRLWRLINDPARKIKPTNQVL